MPDRFVGMKVFSRVAALGSLSAAGRALGMSQTMATKHLAALEDRLGVKLVHRTTRRMTLTEAGRRYLEACDRILSDIEDAEAAVSVDRVEVRGTLRMSVPVSFGIGQIAPLMAEFSARNPELIVELGLNDRFVDLIEEGWDLAVRIGRLADSTMIARRLAPCGMAVCASPAYLARHGQPETIADLARHNCLGYTLSRSLGPGQWAFGPGGKVKIAVTGSLNANNGDALVAAAVAGLGIIYQPTFLVARELRAGALVALTLDQDPVALDGIYAAYPSDRSPPAKVRAMVEFLAAKWARDPSWQRA